MRNVRFVLAVLSSAFAVAAFAQTGQMLPPSGQIIPDDGDLKVRRTPKPTPPGHCQKCTQRPPGHYIDGKNYKFDVGTPEEKRGTVDAASTDGKVALVLDVRVAKPIETYSVYLYSSTNGEVIETHELPVENGRLKGTIETDLEKFELAIAPERGLTKIMPALDLIAAREPKDSPGGNCHKCGGPPPWRYTEGTYRFDIGVDDAVRGTIAAESTDGNVQLQLNVRVAKPSALYTVYLYDDDGKVLESFPMRSVDGVLDGTVRTQRTDFRIAISPVPQLENVLTETDILTTAQPNKGP